MSDREVDSILWASPKLFVWQPGHRWGLKAPKMAPDGRSHITSVSDSKDELLASRPAKELGALTLASGLTIKFSRRALDTDAFFSVKSVGNSIELVLNSTHEVFSRLPLPFDDAEGDASPYRELVEVLLSAWALYEDGVGDGPSKRPLEDARLFWGRRTIEMLRE